VYSCYVNGETQEDVKYNITWYCNEHEYAFFMEDQYDGPENEDLEDEQTPDPELPPHPDEPAEKRTKWFRDKYDGVKTIVNCKADFTIPQSIRDYQVISALVIGIIKYTSRQYIKFLSQQDVIVGKDQYNLELGVNYEIKGCSDPPPIIEQEFNANNTFRLFLYVRDGLKDAIKVFKEHGERELEKVDLTFRKKEQTYRETTAKNDDIQYIRLERKRLAQTLQLAKEKWDPTGLPAYSIEKCKRIFAQSEAMLRKSKHGHTNPQEINSAYRYLLDCLKD